MANAALAWTIEPTPGPSGQAPILQAVTCVTATNCLAVGYMIQPSPPAMELPLAESWNGSTWTILSTPSPKLGGSLEGISCASATSCMAVGSEQATGTHAKALPMAESWNGSTWTIQPTPAKTAAIRNVLDAVSCASATSCTAVGDYYSSNGTIRVLAQHWNGSSWILQGTPNPAGTDNNTLLGVSCPVTTNCTAVGDATTHTTGLGPLAEGWLL